MNTKNALVIFGILFLVIGCLGFTANPIVSAHDAIFHADIIHNMFHILSGFLFLIVRLSSKSIAPTFLKVFGAFYFLIGVIGIANYGTDGMGQLFGFLHVNGADNFLHIILGALIFACGFMNNKRTIVKP